MEEINVNMVSVICPIYNEEKYIKEFICSIINQDFPKDKLEILFIDGMSKDKTREILLSYIEEYKYIKLLDNQNKTVSYALNIGIKESSGDIIIRLDAHCIYPMDYISTLIQKMEDLNADNVGGVCVTLPASNNVQSIAVAEVSSHRFGVGNSYFRIGADEIKTVDTVPFGCFRKEVFDKIGLFDTDLIRNQDDEFNSRIINNGGKIFLIPDIIIKYYARDNIFKMSKMYYQYGLFKPLVNKKLSKPATIRQFFPPLFVASIAIGAVLSLYFKLILLLYLSVLILYFALGFFFGAKIAVKNKKGLLLLIIPITFLVIHMSYGYGYLKGVFLFFIKNKDSYTYTVESNR